MGSFCNSLVNTIGSVDGLIEKNQEIVAKLNKYAKLLIESLPKEKSIKLVDFININTGKLNANQADLNGKYPFFTCSENQTYINTYAFDCEAILVSGNGSQLGYTNYYKGKFNAYQRTYVLTAEKWFYIWYFALKHNINKITSQAIGSAIPYLTKPMFEEFSINVFNNNTSNDLLNNKLGALTNMIFRYQSKISQLERIKSLLLNKYFS